MPARAKEAPKSEVTMLLPTPPLPEMMAIVFLKELIAWGFQLFDFAAARTMFFVAAVAFVIAIFFAHNLPAFDDYTNSKGSKVIEYDKLDKRGMYISMTWNDVGDLALDTLKDSALILADGVCHQFFALFL
jgi:hypothetical protein